MRAPQIGAIVIWALASQAAASEATLVLRLPSGGNPQALDVETGKSVNGAASEEDWIYELDFGEGQILKRLKLTITGIQNPDMLSNLSVNYPFFRKGDLLVVLAPPVEAGSGSDAARRIWGTSVQDMSSEQLLEFYQRAKRVSILRTDNFTVNWETLHPYDVRSAFKYLEAAVALSKQLYIVPPDDVSKARDWLSDATVNAPDTVDTAVGLANAKQLVQNIDNDEGRRFGLLWSAIKDLTPCEKRKVYLQAYRDWFRKVPSDTRRERIVSVTGVPIAMIESGLAQCVAVSAKQAVATGTPEDKEAAKAELNEHIDTLQRTLDETTSRSLARKLGSDLSVLTNMRRLF